ncbi:MAG: hypothetical protein M5U12_33230 [Verrucomicrobia bacterium]|nr:hypothetical protein [Verrucomicrobiota bacterium]
MKLLNSLLALALLGVVPAGLAQGTAFTYQGQLADGGVPVTGSYDVRAILYNADLGGSQVGLIITNLAVSVERGCFTTPLDFGPGVFDGSRRWLEIAVRPSGSGSFTALNPRQELTPAPLRPLRPDARGSQGRYRTAGTAGTDGARGTQG